ncbi:putative porin, partial [Salmonella enterica]|uniref:putative porin n=2 Tax=Pseudomonadota TaxID=1224 RepID=UPI003CF3676D
RNIPFTPGSTTLFQFYGLASDFRPVVASGQLDFAQFNPVHIILDAEYIWNTAFDRAAVAAVVVGPNNTAPSSTPNVFG